MSNLFFLRRNLNISTEPELEPEAGNYTATEPEPEASNYTATDQKQNCDTDRKEPRTLRTEQNRPVNSREPEPDLESNCEAIRRTDQNQNQTQNLGY